MGRSRDFSAPKESVNDKITVENLKKREKMGCVEISTRICWGWSMSGFHATLTQEERERESADITFMTHVKRCG